MSRGVGGGPGPGAGPEGRSSRSAAAAAAEARGFRDAISADIGRFSSGRAPRGTAFSQDVSYDHKLAIAKERDLQKRQAETFARLNESIEANKMDPALRGVMSLMGFVPGIGLLSTVGMTAADLAAISNLEGALAEAPNVDVSQARSIVDAAIQDKGFFGRLLSGNVLPGLDVRNVGNLFGDPSKPSSGPLGQTGSNVSGIASLFPNPAVVPSGVANVLPTTSSFQPTGPITIGNPLIPTTFPFT